MRARTVLLLVLAVVGAGALGLWRLAAARDAERAEGIATSRTWAWARSEGGAGPSILPKRVPVDDERELCQFEDLPGFHDHAMRCSSCHELPDPAAYPAKKWIRKVDEMREHIGRAHHAASGERAGGGPGVPAGGVRFPAADVRSVAT